MGNSQEKSLELAIYLKEKLVDDERKSVQVVVKKIDQTIFDLLLEYLNEQNSKTEMSEFKIKEYQNDEKIIRVKVTSVKYSDSIDITHYRTNDTLMFQGKPLYTFCQISYFMAEFTDYNGFMEIAYKGITYESIEINTDIVNEELKIRLSNSYELLGDTINKMLLSSFIFKGLIIELPEYSCFVFPALRALEGVINKTLSEYEIIVDNNVNSFKNIFYQKTDGSFVLNSRFSDKIGFVNTNNSLESFSTKSISRFPA